MTILFVCFCVDDYSGFLPVAVNFLRRVPVIGMLLYLPGISHVCINVTHSMLPSKALNVQSYFTFCITLY